MVDDAYPEWRGRATATAASRRRLSLSELEDEECLGLAASLAHQNCAVAAFSSTLPRAGAASATTSAPAPPSSRER